MVPQGAKVEAPGLPNDRFGPPKVTISVSKIKDICKKVTWKLASRNQRACTHFSREKNRKGFKHLKISKPANKGPAAVGEALKIRRGAFSTSCRRVGNPSSKNLD